MQSYRLEDNPNRAERHTSYFSKLPVLEPPFFVYKDSIAAKNRNHDPCERCRKSKLKCKDIDEDGICGRCRKGGKECVRKTTSIKPLAFIIEDETSKYVPSAVDGIVVGESKSPDFKSEDDSFYSSDSCSTTSLNDSSDIDVDTGSIDVTVGPDSTTCSMESSPASPECTDCISEVDITIMEQGVDNPLPLLDLNQAIDSVPLSQDGFPGGCWPDSPDFHSGILAPNLLDGDWPEDQNYTPDSAEPCALLYSQGQYTGWDSSMTLDPRRAFPLQQSMIFG